MTDLNELQRRFLNDAEFHAEVELARRQLLAEGVAITTESVILVVNALRAAREDTERPDAQNGAPCDCQTPGDWHRVANDFQRAMFDEQKRVDVLRSALISAIELLDADSFDRAWIEPLRELALGHEQEPER